MKRQYRTLIVMVVAVATAALASFAVYRAVRSMPVREVEVEVPEYEMAETEAIAK